MDKCPHCGDPVSDDMAEDYAEEGCYSSECGECGKDITVITSVRITHEVRSPASNEQEPPK